MRRKLMKNIYGLLLILVFGASVSSAQVDMAKALSMTKAEAEKMIGNQSSRELSTSVCNGYVYQLKKEGGVIRVDSYTTITNAQSRGNACVQKFEIEKNTLADTVAKAENLSHDVGLLILNKPQTSKILLKDMKDRNTQTYCNIPTMRAAIDHGLILEYIVQYNTGETLGSFTISDKDCNQVKGIVPVNIEIDNIPVQKPVSPNTPQKKQAYKIPENINEIVLWVSLIMLFAYLIFGGKKKKDDEEKEDSKEVTESSSLLSERSEETTIKSDEEKKSNDMVPISIIFIITYVVMLLFTAKPYLSLAFNAGQILLPSLFIAVVPFYIYKGIVVFIKTIKED